MYLCLASESPALYSLCGVESYGTDTGSNVEINSFMHYSTTKVNVTYSKMKPTSLHWR